jgi:hypothetical protein
MMESEVDMVMSNRTAEGTSMDDGLAGGTEVGDRMAQLGGMFDLRSPSLAGSCRNLLEHTCIADGSSAPPSA